MNSQVVPPPSGLELKPIVVDGTSFALNGMNVSYRFHVDEASGELISDHFGGLVTESPVLPGPSRYGGWSSKGALRCEFPDLGRGDFRTPAVMIKHDDGFTVSDFRYESHTILEGKPGLDGLPATFGTESEVKTLVIHMFDDCTSVAADLSYSIFPRHDAIARSIKVTNKGKGTITIDKLASLSVDLPYRDYEMIGLHGEWSRERTRLRRRVDYGTQGFGSSTGYSSHLHNPFLSLVTPKTTEEHGEAWGFSLVYTGSFSAEVEKSALGLVRASIGMNSQQLSWPLKSGESFTSPECVSVFSGSGIGGMSRSFHRLYRQHLIKSKFINMARPVLLNSWEGVYFNFDENTIKSMAQASANLGVKLFVLDDGWYGVKHPRASDNAALGDWKADPAKLPNGLKSLAEDVTKIQVMGQERLQFGLWVEPEMVSPKSELYERHPDWALSAGRHVRTETRQQLVLNLALRDVQDYIIDSMSDILKTAPVTYIKWDNNRGIHECPTPQTYHAYIIGMYRVFDELTRRFPDVLWEGCASGGGRFDPGVLQYFPQVWTSDTMDALDRIHIQFGTSVVYPPSTMGAHIGCNPSEVTGRSTSIHFRAHVAMMGGSFGIELDPGKMPESDKKEIPGLISLAEKISPIVIGGDMWRLSLPEESNHPAALYLSEDGSQGVLFAFQLIATMVHENPTIQLQGLDPSARYKFNGDRIFSGATLMNGGIKFGFSGDFESKVELLERI